MANANTRSQTSRLQEFQPEWLTLKQPAEERDAPSLTVGRRPTCPISLFLLFVCQGLLRQSTFFSTINSQTRKVETPQTRFCPLISGQFPRILGRCPFILGQWRVCRVFSQHFGTLLKTRKDFSLHYGTVSQQFGTMSQHFGTDCTNIGCESNCKKATKL